VVELCEQLFSSRISTGTVGAILARAADALIEPCEDLLERVRAARAVNMDETGCAAAGGRCGARSPTATRSCGSSPTATRIAPRPCSPTRTRS
jgi:hypothetical protein